MSLRLDANSAERQVLEMEQRRRPDQRTPDRWVGASQSPIPEFTILGGNTLVAPVAPGIVYRSDTVADSELPTGSGGPGIVIVPAWPIPAGLPNGVGVCRRVGAAEYFFVLLDSTNLALVNYDLKAGDSLFGYSQFTRDRIVGATTWRYTFIALEGV